MLKKYVCSWLMKQRYAIWVTASFEQTSVFSSPRIPAPLARLFSMSSQFIQSVHLLGHVWPFVTPCTIARQAPLSMGVLQARILDWVSMPSSRGSPQSRDQTQVSCIAGGLFTVWDIREALEAYSVSSPPLLFPCFKLLSLLSSFLSGSPAGFPKSTITLLPPVPKKITRMIILNLLYHATFQAK